MLRRLAVALNVLVILAGAGFVYGGLYKTAGLALLLGGMNVLMLRPVERAGLSLWPIAVNLALMSVGNLGAVVGVGYLYGDPQPGVTLETQHATGRLLVMLCPLLSAAGLIACIVFFQRLLEARRSARS